MKKIVLAIATAATLAVTAVAAPAPAEARGGRVAAGVLGGLAAGALIAGAASGAYAYGPRYGITALPTSPARRAAGRASVSGTAMAGAFEPCGFATDPVTT